MSFLVIVVGFGKPPPDNMEALLNYAAFDENTRGKNIWGHLTQYDIISKVEGVFPIVLKMLDETITSDNLPVIMYDTLPPDKVGDQLFLKRRQKQCVDVMLELTRRLGLETEAPTEPLGLDNLIGWVFKDAAPTMNEQLARDERDAIMKANKPNPEEGN